MDGGSGLFAGKPAPTTGVATPPHACECDGAATVNGQGYWPAGLAYSRVNPRLQRTAGHPDR
ncbi:hypothetical protein PRJ_3946 [Pseudomonas sp. XWY-1]|nr:hypothetical protein PRJ_3946 [Pseudomonas sp. XWY-1]